MYIVKINNYNTVVTDNTKNIKKVSDEEYILEKTLESL
jgi:hypothetical protein